MLTSPYRSAIAAATGVCVMLTIWLNLDHIEQTSVSSIIPFRPVTSNPSSPGVSESVGASHGLDHRPSTVANYFNQVFSLGKPAPYDFPSLSDHCSRVEWSEDVYIHCAGMFAGMTSIMSEMKVCLKMAIDTGSNLVLPTIPLRDSTELKDFSIKNEAAYHPYKDWFDAEHLIEGLGRACPQMKVLYAEQIDQEKEGHVAIKNDWIIDPRTAPGYTLGSSYFWTGNPFKSFFDGKLAELQKLHTDFGGPDDGHGITMIKVDAVFVLFRITDDPTGNDLRFWNDLGLLLRFLEQPRKIVNQLSAHINRPFYGVHFRVENDTIWSSLENQLALDLDALDKAWELYSKDVTWDESPQKPLIYLACGDKEQVKTFQAAGAKRGWEVTHKWEIAQKSGKEGKQTLKMINDLAFDFQGAVDMGMMLQAHFFIGISGSAFSSTVANARDVTGRYRGSSIGGLIVDDGARNHLFVDGGDRWYPCCL